MSVYSGPEISNSGLVFHYDSVNKQKSWKGKPTTNLNSSQGLAAVQTISLTYVGLDNGWKKYALSGTWSSGSYPYSMCITTATFIGGLTYSAQALIKTNVRYKFSNFGTLIYVNDPNMVSGGTATTAAIGYDIDGLQIISLKREGVIYSTIYANPTTSQPGYIYSNPTADGVSFNPATDFVWVKDVQVEQNAFCTPYIVDARSNTQALSDLTKTKTITANSLTYDASGTFSFNGTADYLTITNTELGNGNVPWTVNAWVKTITTANGPGLGSILSNANSGPVYSMMGVNAGKIVYWTYQNSAWAQKLGIGKTVNDGMWHMLTWVNYNNYTMSMYVDGVLDSNVPNSTSGNNNPVDRIGGSWAGYFAGSISALNIYNRALSATEIQQNFEAVRTRYGL